MSNFLKFNTAMVGFGRVLGQKKYKRNNILKHSPTHPKQHIDAIELNELAVTGMLSDSKKQQQSSKKMLFKSQHIKFKIQRNL